MVVVVVLFSLSFFSFWQTLGTWVVVVVVVGGGGGGGGGGGFV